MDPTTAAVLVIIVFAIILIVAFVGYPRIKASIKGPFNTGLEVDGSGQEAPANSPAIKAQDITSRQGGLMADDRTGRGVEVSRADVADDVLLSSAPPPTDPKATPPA